MDEKHLSSIRSAIKSRGYSWEAGETPLSALGKNDQKAWLGLSVSKAELNAMGKAVEMAEGAQKAMFALPSHGAVAVPVVVDWRNYNGGNWITPIKNQGGCGSCVAFGTAATLEARTRIACRNLALVIDLSEAHLFYCGCGNCCGSGWNFGPALDFCKNTGLAKESDFPYTAANQPCRTGLSPYGRISAWSGVLSVADRKTCLASKGPVVGGMAVYADFFSYKSGVYRRTSNDLRGYHAISVIGYDDTNQCWICKNSWGTSWGDAGFFRIGYGQCNIDTNFAFYDMTAICPIPSDVCKQYVPTLLRVIQMARGNIALRRCLMYYVCGIGSKPACSQVIIQILVAVLSILRRCPKYKVPFCNAIR